MARPTTYAKPARQKSDDSIAEAEESLIYWKRKAATSTKPAEIASAKALAAAWSTTLAASQALRRHLLPGN